MLHIKDYKTYYPEELDTVENLPGLNEGKDLTRASQINELRDVTLELQRQVGSDIEELGSLRQRVTTLEETSGFNLGNALWRWNGTDLTQFDSKVEGSGVSSSTIQVVNYVGLSWIRFDITVTSGTAFQATGVFLPINFTAPDANYGCVADFLLGSSPSWAGAFTAVRYDGLETAYAHRGRGTTSGYFIDKLTSGPTRTQLGPIQYSPDPDAANLGHQLGVYVDGQSIIKSYSRTAMFIGDTSSPITSIGKAAIGITTSGTSTTAQLYARNIVVFNNRILGY